MKTRKQVAAFINKGTSKREVREQLEELFEKNAYHFGKKDLRVLLDFIYEGKPTCKAEEISSCDLPIICKKVEKVEIVNPKESKWDKFIPEGES